MLDKVWIGPVALTLMVSCTEMAGTDDAERGPLGKADAYGSCLDDDGSDRCGGPSDGNCWCDDECESVGDCCADKAGVCDHEAVVIGEEDDGGSVEIVEGELVEVWLSSNPSTGYDWHVATTDRTFGYPIATDFIPDGDTTGGAGMTVLTWATVGTLSMVGSHTVMLEHRRAWETSSAETFTFTVDIVAD